MVAMKFIDEFRDSRKARALVGEIEALVPKLDCSLEQPLQLMEVCGGHTHAIFKYGIHTMLPREIEFVHGPGCPVCVLPMGRVDDCVALAEHPSVIFATFGDAMRVPGSKKSLLQAKADGADVRMVYSPMDCLKIASDNPGKEVVFFGLGFETTMPSSAHTVLAAETQRIDNFSLFCNHITIIPTIRAILDAPDIRLDGFIGPGHVSMVIGLAPYAFIAGHYRKPVVISGFEPLDILQSVWMLLKQLAEQRCTVENQYGRIVPFEGNRAALAAVERVFELREHFEWRGLGSIRQSGVRLRERYARYDAERRFSIPNLKVTDPKDCQCGEVLTGLVKPWQCRVFGTRCKPETPLGALMVSSEGACAAYYSNTDIRHLRPAADDGLSEEAAE
jgi:hydrogenase expression/formation protein HypD